MIRFIIIFTLVFSTCIKARESYRAVNVVHILVDPDKYLNVNVSVSGFYYAANSSLARLYLSKEHGLVRDVISSVAIQSLVGQESQVEDCNGKYVVLRGKLVKRDLISPYKLVDVKGIFDMQEGGWCWSREKINSNE